MKYSLDNSHREFFAQHGWIEFEDLLSAAEIAQLTHGINTVLAKRLDAKPDRVSADELFLAGRDVWRDSAPINKIISGRRLAEMASELCDARPLRLAFDQVFVPGQNTIAMVGNLNELTSFQGLVCGMILCLQNATETTFFPGKPGSGIVISPTLKIDYSALFKPTPQRYLMIGYGKAVTLFVHRPNDPHALALRQLGYNYSDKLVDSKHPIVYR